MSPHRLLEDPMGPRVLSGTMSATHVLTGTPWAHMSPMGIGVPYRPPCHLEAHVPPTRSPGPYGLTCPSRAPVAPTGSHATPWAPMSPMGSGPPQEPLGVPWGIPPMAPVQGGPCRTLGAAETTAAASAGKATTGTWPHLAGRRPPPWHSPAWHRHGTAVATGWAGGHEVRSRGWGAPEPWEQGTPRMGTPGVGRWEDTRARQWLSLGGHWSWGTPGWGHRGGDTAARGDPSPRAPSHPDSSHPSIATGLSPSALHTLVHVHARLRSLPHACTHSDMPEPPPACSHALAHSRAHTGTLLPHTHRVVGG